MDKSLNLPSIEAKLEELGLNQSKLAEQVGLSRAAISKWMKGTAFPRPPELLKLGRVLGLMPGDLVIKPISVHEPLVAFRKKGASKTTEDHIQRAREMGEVLRPLIPYLGFDEFFAPPSLKRPSSDYEYIQDVALKIRRELDVEEDERIEFEDLIKKFHEYQAVIIPTMRGSVKNHENALHIHLPDSMTTWIYLNLDSEIHDFKFWMAHEFGHILSVDLLRDGKSEEAEDFGDSFAGALLFPRPAAEEYAPRYRRAKTDASRIKILMDAAKEFVISPLSVYKELEKLSEYQKWAFTEVEPTSLFPAISKFNKRYKTVSEMLFDGDKPTPNQFMRVAQETFGTEIYKALGKYLKSESGSVGHVSKILGIRLVDAKAIYAALVK